MTNIKSTKNHNKKLLNLEKSLPVFKTSHNLEECKHSLAYKFYVISTKVDIFQVEQNLSSELENETSKIFVDKINCFIPCASPPLVKTAIH